MKISVITVCYNCMDEISLTVENVLLQTYGNVEYIIVDGASTDGTLEYLKLIEDSVDLLISEPDSGIYDAMNKGAVAAEGDYIIFMNAGDRFRHPDVLKYLVNEGVFLEGKAIVSGRIQYEYNGEMLDFFRPSVAGKEGFGLPHQATFVHSSIQRKHLFDLRYRYVGDYELWRRLDSMGLYSVRYIDSVVSIFSLGGVSTNIKHDSARYFERFFVDYTYSNKMGLMKIFKLFMKVLLRRLMAIVVGEYTLFKMLRLLKKVNK